MFLIIKKRVFYKMCNTKMRNFLIINIFFEGIGLMQNSTTKNAISQQVGSVNENSRVNILVESAPPPPH